MTFPNHSSTFSDPVVKKQVYLHMVQFEIFDDPVETTGSPVPSELPQCSLTSGFLSPWMSPPLQSTKKPQHFCRGFGSVCLSVSRSVHI